MDEEEEEEGEGVGGRPEVSVVVITSKLEILKNGMALKEGNKYSIYTWKLAL